MIQSRRKELGCEFTDRIEVGIVCDDADVQAAIEGHRSRIANETLANVLELQLIGHTEPQEIRLDEVLANMYMRVVCTPTRP